MRTTLQFNSGWLYAPEVLEDYVPDSRFEAITLPHTNVVLPHNHFHDREYQFVSTYRKRFRLPEPRAGRRVYLEFEGAMMAATVRLNGHSFGEHQGGYVPFAYDITDYVRDDGDNLLTVHLDSSERADIPPCGGRIDYLTYGGIYRYVMLRYVEPVHIKDVFVKAHGLLHDDERVELAVRVRNQTNMVQRVVVVGGMEYWRDEIGIAEIPAYGEETVTLWSDLREMPLNQRALWSPDDPALHTFFAKVYAEAGFNGIDEVQYDEISVRAGLRVASFTDEGFYLNGEQVFLRGLNRHQAFPYFGYAAPARLQQSDADIIKYELGCNIVRCSHYPQSKYFLDRCDEIGLLVFEEIPGWQHIGDTLWQTLSLRDVTAMIERDRNHPSIIIWGVRINESLDDHDFYKRTNDLARRLDPTRPTSGVRYFQESEFLEDVFGFNDFSNTVQEPANTPHLITEFNGHMFPTKTFDGEERQMEHALRHARIQDRALGMGGVSGAIGWCAFDYNTHKDFGSGDRVCYHGVMDMFRLPKYAAHVYASQVPPTEKIVLQAATIWSIGDRSTGGNDPLVVLSNCDSLEMFIGEELYGRFKPARDQFPYLPHPPFVIPVPMNWGQEYHDLHLIGYIDGEAVAEHHIAIDGQPARLEIGADDNELHADGMDMTRVWFKVTEKYGNRLPFCNVPVMFEIDGPCTFFGENPYALIGGQAAVWIRATHEAGTVTIKAHSPRLESRTIQIEMVKG